MVKKILLVEDDKKISELVKQSLLSEGYFVDQSFDGESGYYKIIEGKWTFIKEQLDLENVYAKSIDYYLNK